MKGAPFLYSYYAYLYKKKGKYENTFISHSPRSKVLGDTEIIPLHNAKAALKSSFAFREESTPKAMLFFITEVKVSPIFTNNEEKLEYLKEEFIV